MQWLVYFFQNMSTQPKFIIYITGQENFNKTVSFCQTFNMHIQTYQCGNKRGILLFKEEDFLITLGWVNKRFGVRYYCF